MKPIPHSRPTLAHPEIAALLRVVRSGQISRGQEVLALEEALARYLDVAQTAAVSSGTAGLHLALAALGVTRGDEIVLPTHVCSALLNAVRYVGAKEKLVDVREDGNIDPAGVRAALTKKTKVVIVPHMWGMPADIKAIVKYGVPVIEDCAQSVGASINGKKVGSFGKIAVFSLYATKMLAAGEGGMVASSDRVLMTRVRDLLDYDHKPDYQVRFNYKMTDLQAALGRSQLKQLGGFISRRREIARHYHQAFESLNAGLPQITHGVQSACYRYVLVAPPGRVQGIIRRANAAGVHCAKPLFRPLHQYLKLNSRKFPVSEALMQKTVSVPIYPSMTSAEEKSVIRGVMDAWGRVQAVKG